MWPLLTLDVSPVKAAVQVKTFVDVSRLAVNVPFPVGLPASVPGSPAGVIVAVNLTIFETGGDDVSLPPQAASAAIAAAMESNVVRLCIMGSFRGMSILATPDPRRPYCARRIPRPGP